MQRFANDKIGDQWREPLSSSMTGRTLLQQPIPVFDRVRMLVRSYTDFFCIVHIHRVSVHCRTDNSEDLHDVSLEKR